jgi:hypothetical protein
MLKVIICTFRVLFFFQKNNYIIIEGQKLLIGSIIIK